jgi:phage shock protein PspC (stress-responsive transcriptional regulator)
MNSNASITHPRRFHRSTSDKMLAGVAGGLGDYFSVDPVLFRVGFAVATVLTGGLAAVAYVALVVVRPTDMDEPAADSAHPVAA